MASLRRSSAKLLSIGSSHSELIVAISQWKELRSVAKEMLSAQEATANDLLKWSNKEENRAVRDVIERFTEICSLWSDAFKVFTEDLKDVRNHFEVIFFLFFKNELSRGYPEVLSHFCP